MRQVQTNAERLDRAVLVFLVGVLMFVSPFTFWWAANTRVWYLPYALWLVLIVLIAWVARRSHDDL
ncbi:MAG TPA: hypothetical protein VF678_13285 [bacterium]